MREQWRKLSGWEGDYYEVSDRGRVRSKDRYVAAGKGGLGEALRRGRILQPVVKGNGYHVVTLAGEGKRRQHAIHNLVLAAFVGEKPDGEVGRHLNDRKSDNRLSNLCYGTHKDNAADSIVNGGRPRGSRHGMAKLTEDDVRNIRKLKLDNETLAALYNVHPVHIWSIRTRRSWRHI